MQMVELISLISFSSLRLSVRNIDQDQYALEKRSEILKKNEVCEHTNDIWLIFPNVLLTRRCGLTIVSSTAN